MFNRNIAIDKDDTLNWLTKDICDAAGIPKEHIPTLDVIKSGRASEEFYKAREVFFAEPSNFANKPYGLAHKIVSKAKEYDFNPMVCTKTMSDHPRGGEIVMHKFNFLRKHFPDTEAQIVIGRKFPDAIALIDDSYNNCLHFNKTENRPFLVWNHKTAEEETLDIFYTYVNFYYKSAIIDPRILKEKPQGHLIKMNTKDQDEPYFEMVKSTNYDSDVYLGNFLIARSSPRMCAVYASSEIFDLDREEFEKIMANTVGGDACFDLIENEAAIKTICYNLFSRYAS